jgi:hypothetical protein
MSFYYAECKDSWGVPRDLASDLCSGSRGHCPSDNSWPVTFVLGLGADRGDSGRWNHEFDGFFAFSR